MPKLDALIVGVIKFLIVLVFIAGFLLGSKASGRDTATRNDSLIVNATSNFRPTNA
jgi:hypothetical protein